MLSPFSLTLNTVTSTPVFIGPLDDEEDCGMWRDSTHGRVWGLSHRSVRRWTPLCRLRAVSLFLVPWWLGSSWVRSTRSCPVILPESYDPFRLNDSWVARPTSIPPPSNHEPLDGEKGKVLRTKGRTIFHWLLGIRIGVTQEDFSSRRICGGVGRLRTTDLHFWYLDLKGSRSSHWTPGWDRVV